MSLIAAMLLSPTLLQGVQVEKVITNGADEDEVSAIRTLTVSEKPDSYLVDTGACIFELGHDGRLRYLAADGAAVVENNEMPLLAAQLFESTEYDGWRDHAAGEFIAGNWKGNGCSVNHAEAQWEAVIHGSLEFDDIDSLQCRLTVKALPGSACLDIDLEVSPRGTFQNRFLRSLALRLPLTLDKRKRVVQAGDRGLQWDTRHWYQYNAVNAVNLPVEPDHNIWRRFVIDQISPHDFSIWRGESDVTAPLIMQRGEQAPGWMSVYDRGKGLLFAMRDFSGLAPRALEVLAEGAGEVSIFFWSPTHAPLQITEQTALFAKPLRTTWLPYADAFRELQPDKTLAAHWGLPGFASDEPARAEIPASGTKLFTAEAADDIAPLISGGVPLPRGALRDPANVHLSRNGNSIPLQGNPLAFWPDGSIKWLLLVFPLDGGAVEGAKGGGDSLTFEVNRRDGSATEYELNYGGAAFAGKPQHPLKVTLGEGCSEIDTGPLQITLATSTVWISSAVVHGKSLLGPEGISSFVNMSRAETPPRAGDTVAAGVADDGEFLPDSLTVEEAGPLRAVVRLEGRTTAQETQRLIVRLEAYAGRSSVRIFQSVIMQQKDPREAFVRSMGISVQTPELEYPLVRVGLAGSRALSLQQAWRSGIRQHSHLACTAWHQEEDARSVIIDTAGQRSEGWLDVSGSNGGIMAVLRDMWQQAPGELTFDRSNGRLNLYFWPESLPAMDMRRYSNYPHGGQGETAGRASDWVAETYYNTEPVVGISKTHEVVLYFHEPSETAGTTQPERLAALAADVQDRPLIFCGSAWYHNCGVIQPGYRLPGAADFERMDANFEHFAEFWLFHQKLWGWYGLWDYGDIGHSFRSGYGWRLPADDLAKVLQIPPEEVQNDVIRKLSQRDYSPNHDWAFDNGRWGWGNTEGLPNLYFQTQYLRTGNRALFFFCEAMARHERDVDMRHDGRWFGRGTRHGVQHWSDYDHEERQTTQSETRYHYFLTGEARTRDFLQELYQKIHTKVNVNNAAWHSGRLQGLMTWWEMTGDPQVAELLDRYVSAFITEEGLCESPSVSFPQGERQRIDAVNAGSMFFWVFGAGHALLEYYYLTGREDLKEALVKAAAAYIKEKNNPNMMRKGIAFAALHAENPEPYRSYLANWAQGDDMMKLLQIVPHNREHYSGPTAFGRSNSVGSWFIMNDLLYTVRALEREPSPGEKQLAEIKRTDAEGGTPRRPPLMSWQDDYDNRPELEEYLRIKHPQP